MHKLGAAFRRARTGNSNNSAAATRKADAETTNVVTEPVSTAQTKATSSVSFHASTSALPKDLDGDLPLLSASFHVDALEQGRFSDSSREGTHPRSSRDTAVETELEEIVVDDDGTATEELADPDFDPGTEQQPYSNMESLDPDAIASRPAAKEPAIGAQSVSPRTSPTAPPSAPRVMGDMAAVLSQAALDAREARLEFSALRRARHVSSTASSSPRSGGSRSASSSASSVGRGASKAQSDRTASREAPDDVLDQDPEDPDLDKLGTPSSPSPPHETRAWDKRAGVDPRRISSSPCADAAAVEAVVAAAASTPVVETPDEATSSQCGNAHGSGQIAQESSINSAPSDGTAQNESPKPPTQSPDGESTGPSTISSSVKVVRALRYGNGATAPTGSEKTGRRGSITGRAKTVAAVASRFGSGHNATESAFAETSIGGEYDEDLARQRIEVARGTATMRAVSMSDMQGAVSSSASTRTDSGNLIPFFEEKAGRRATTEKNGPGKDGKDGTTKKKLRQNRRKRAGAGKSGRMPFVGSTGSKGSDGSVNADRVEGSHRSSVDLQRPHTLLSSASAARPLRGPSVMVRRVSGGWRRGQREDLNRHAEVVNRVKHVTGAAHLAKTAARTRTAPDMLVGSGSGLAGGKSSDIDAAATEDAGQPLSPRMSTVAKLGREAGVIGGSMHPRQRTFAIGQRLSSSELDELPPSGIAEDLAEKSSRDSEGDDTLEASRAPSQGRLANADNDEKPAVDEPTATESDSPVAAAERGLLSGLLSTSTTSIPSSSATLPSRPNSQSSTTTASSGAPASAGLAPPQTSHFRSAAERRRPCRWTSDGPPRNFGAISQRRDRAEARGLVATCAILENDIVALEERAAEIASDTDEAAFLESRASSLRCALAVLEDRYDTIENFYVKGREYARAMGKFYQVSPEEYERWNRKASRAKRTEDPSRVERPSSGIESRNGSTRQRPQLAVASKNVVDDATRMSLR